MKVEKPTDSSEFELGLSYDARKRIRDEVCPELAHLTESSTYIERLEADVKHSKRLGISPFAESVINALAEGVHEANKKWWEDLETGLPKDRNAGEMIALIHSELSEALEGTRKSLMDDKLPHRKMEEVEMADALIRLLDYCAGRKLDIGGAFVEKMLYNATRKDHTREERLKPNGKKI